jgi:hypothetical protein
MRLPYRFLLPCALLASAACGSASEPSADTPLEAFDVVWKAFDRTYPYFVLKGADWAAARATYRPRATVAADVAELNRILTEMLAPLRDLHVWIESPGGTRVATYQPTAPRNWDPTLWQRALSGNGWVQVKPNLGRARIDGIPYILIGSWNSSQFSVEDLDATLEAFRADSALIVDVRPNGGGNDALALALAGRFTTRSILTEIIRTRSGPAHGDLGNETRRTLQPRGPWTFDGRVYVLSGRGVFSSNESFIAAMRELPRGVIVGDTTGGATANPKPTEYFQGWKIWVPTWYATTPDGMPIEWRGIPPDVFVPWSAAGERDPVIDAAVALAKGR